MNHKDKDDSVNKRLENDRGEDAYQLLMISLAGETYAVAFDQVEEVVRIKDVTRIPRAPAFIRGVTQLRGEIITIGDIRYLLGTPQQELTPSGTHALITNVAGFRIGFLCEKKYGLLTVAVREVRPPLATLPRRMLRFVRGQVQQGEKIFPWLDLKSLCECEEFQRLKKGDAHALRQDIH